MRFTVFAFLLSLSSSAFAEGHEHPCWVKDAKSLGNGRTRVFFSDGAHAFGVIDPSEGKAESSLHLDGKVFVDDATPTDHIVLEAERELALLWAHERRTIRLSQEAGHEGIAIMAISSYVAAGQQPRSVRTFVAFAAQ